MSIANKLTLAAAACMALLTLSSEASAQTYQVTDLSSVISNANFKGQALNDLGQVAGLLSYNTFSNGLAVYQNGSIQANFNWPKNLVGIRDVAAMNNAGDIVGGDLLPYISKGGVITKLGNQFWTPTGINNSGTVVGLLEDTDQSLVYTAVFSNGTLTPLSRPISQSTYGARPSINASGTIATGYMDDNNIPHAATYSQGQWTDIVVPPEILPAYMQGPGYAQTSGINDAGDVIGSYSPRDSTGSLMNPLSYVVHNGVVTMISDPLTPGELYLSTTANGINNLGQVVGSAQSFGPYSHAFVFRDGVAIDLNTLVDVPTGVVLTDAIDINDAGQILVLGTNDLYGGPKISYLLTPVPEASSVAMLATGGLLIGALARRRKPRAD